MLSAFVGQFGGSVGGMVMEEAATERRGETTRERRGDDTTRLVDAKGFSRAVMVDGEAKVVKKWGDRGRLRTENRVWRDSGCGNNWAMGYFGEGARMRTPTATEENENVLVRRAMEVLRREGERLDRCEGCMVYHSLAGGTGSGLGSRLLEEIRDTFSCPLLSVSVLPFSVGELPLQYYNSTLCLSRIVEEADACLLFSNDDILSIMSKRLAKKIGSVVRPGDAAGTLVKTEDLNMHFQTSSKHRSDVQGISWTKLSQQLFTEAPRYQPALSSTSGEALCRIKTCASRLIFRGNAAMSQASEISSSLENELCRSAEQVSWMKGPKSFVYGSPRPIFKHSTKSLTWATTRSSYLPAFTHILHRCEDMLESRAYLHWYVRYGLRAEDMQEAIELMRSWLSDSSEFFGRSLLFN
ncbi:hypothetical protein GUITHDRAFT_135732 [Guillardia theta CCMP2712]|uniref:Tubulin/FtsZ GTPase domain-containing protein n=1 Tax=Guillardia theta (strain CCMP2712) TaxID=905079 RepID=L1JP46_GUITC|nr:hypothetical protein GUITHDRAFT_135732 [Guillardia theta CCMP2712]EKX50064.1 hypothetical protein GUITHDRAFT_135732 [Guillardia theta CCMP2712]|eukprot:XP_005837044.1 hypothetical protein GUITHDRAFT_135732 [Guillardia theta CCMP2712]